MELENKGYSMANLLEDYNYLKKERDKYKKALEFYADTENWGAHPDFYFDRRLMDESDMSEHIAEEGDVLFAGKTARDALGDTYEFVATSMSDVSILERKLNKSKEILLSIATAEGGDRYGHVLCEYLMEKARIGLEELTKTE